MHPDLSAETAKARRSRRMSEARRRNAVAGVGRRRHPCDELRPEASFRRLVLGRVLGLQLRRRAVPAPLDILAAPAARRGRRRTTRIQLYRRWSIRIVQA